MEDNKNFGTIDKEKNKISDVQNDIYDNTVKITKISALAQFFCNYSYSYYYICIKYSHKQF